MKIPQLLMLAALGSLCLSGCGVGEEVGLCSYFGFCDDEDDDDSGWYGNSGTVDHSTVDHSTVDHDK